jgi:gluconate 5-dehydrogenase
MIDANTFRLDDRIALVTGSSTGIGLAIARGLAQAGATLVLNGRDATRLSEAAKQLESEGLRVHARSFDVTRRAEIDTAVASIEAHIGPIDILVNNAGMNRRAPFQDFATADWEAVMRTNVDSVFHVGQAVAKHMIGHKRGRIINICSVMSEITRPGIAPYSASKGAVKMLTKGMAVDLAKHGINVNGIGPGYFRTELNEALANDPTFNNWLIGRTPNARWGELEELAGAAVFLASDASRFVNGHVLYVDGGMTASA